MTGNSAASARAVAFVSDHRAAAERLGASLAEHSNDPDAFAAALQRALQTLADPDHVGGQHRVAPGIGAVMGVRSPLMAALARGFRRATRHDSAGPLLFIIERLLREAHLESRWFAVGLAERTLATEAERTWQVLREAARAADDWITVDSIAQPYAKGIAAEPFRWAELELLVYSPSRWERRLVGSTIATLTHGETGRRLGPEVVDRGLPLLGQLMGDAQPDVQKALSWAYRSLAAVDLDATTVALRAQADLALATGDGHRAWVIRDSLAKLAPTTATALHDALVGIRKRPGAPSTSAATATADRFRRPSELTLQHVDPAYQTRSI
ncbi:MAG: DNA alkylation repair protein [Candidatus Limnocylindrales bacterium]